MKQGSVLRLEETRGGKNPIQRYFSKYGPGSPASESPQKFVKNEKSQVLLLSTTEIEVLDVGLQDIRVFTSPQEPKDILMHF